MDLHGKKLLVLGGTRLCSEIVQKAKELGLFVIVADYDPNSPAKSIADKASMVSAADVDKVVQLIQEEQVDGVLTGFIELLLPFYQQICEKAHLPCYATEEQIEYGTNKIKFKQICRDFGIPVVDEFVLNGAPSQSDIENIPYPVILKPCDNTAGRGINICNDSQEFVEKYPNSLSYSPSQQVIIEKYTPWEEVTIFYAAQDGHVFLTGMADRYVQNRQNNSIPLPVAYIFPARNLDDYLRTLDQKVVAMFESMGVKNGMIFIQSFVKDGHFVFYEMGFRLTASLEYHVLSKTNNINILELLIHYAVTGKMHDEPIYNKVLPTSDKYGANITFLIKPGEIGRIEGVEEILKLPEVTTCFLSYQAGDVIPEKATGTLLQVVARVLLVADSMPELINTMDRIHSIFKVYSPDGYNMLLETLNTEKLHSLFEKPQLIPK